MNKIGISLRNVRKNTSLTLDEVASLSGVNKATLSLIENGKANPSIGTINKILNVLNAHIEIINN